MTTFSPESQRNFSIQWFKSWSDFQKDDFVTVVAQKLGGSSSSSAVNGLVNGMQQLDASSGRPPSLFSCQVKLFNEWWDTWSESDKDKMTELLKEADVKFWETVEAEMGGTRKQLNEDFMIVIAAEDSNGVDETNNTNGLGSGDAPLPAPVFKVKQIVTGSSVANGIGTDGEEIGSNFNFDQTVEEPDDEPENGDSVEDKGQESPISPVATEI